MTDREAMQQALEALEYAADHIGCPDDDDAIGVARKALRERLAKQRETKEGSARVGHLHIQRHPERGIWLSHDNNEAMQTDEDKFYQHLMDYWNKEF